jgi:DNA-binding NarL/FixJ family response regulator
MAHRRAMALTLGPVPVPVPVAIADGSYLIRESLVQMIRAHNGVELVAVCADRGALEAAIERERPRVVLTEIRMRHSTAPDGIQLAARLRQTHPHVGVLMLAGDTNAQYVEQLLESGSGRRGFLLKHKIRDSGELIAAIEAVDRGETVVDPALICVLIRARVGLARSPLAVMRSTACTATTSPRDSIHAGARSRTSWPWLHAGTDRSRHHRSTPGLAPGRRTGVRTAARHPHKLRSSAGRPGLRPAVHTP